MKIISDDKIPFLRGVFEQYNIETVYKKGADITRSDLIDCEALIVRTRTQCDHELLHDTNIKAVATATIGTDHVKINEVENLGIAFFSAPGCNAMSVQQYIICALLHLAEKHNIQLAGKTIGIIGAGHVGSAVEQACRTMNMNVLLNDPPRAAAEGAEKFTGLDKLLTESDFVTMHVPLDKSTYHLADEDFFKQMKHSAFFINSSRGSVCDNNALKNALSCQRIAGAVLDVWENEPHIDRELQNMLELGTMHIAGYSADGKANGTTQSVRNIASVLKITPLLDFKVNELRPGNTEVLRIPALPPQQALTFAAKKAYDIQQDSEDLRMHPENFEKLRGEYHYRREFCGWTLDVSNLSTESTELLKKMNFNTGEKND